MKEGRKEGKKEGEEEEEDDGKVVVEVESNKNRVTTTTILQCVNHTKENS